MSDEFQRCNLTIDLEEYLNERRPSSSSSNLQKRENRDNIRETKEQWNALRVIQEENE